VSPQYRAIDCDGNLVKTMRSEHRNMAAAQAFYRSTKVVTGVIPERVTTDGHGSYPRRSAQPFAIGSCTGPAPTKTTDWNKIIGA
jgi:transposase-like protein